jgi:peptide deformylase
VWGKKKEGPKVNLDVVIVTDLEYLRQVSKPTSLKEIEKKDLVPLIKYALQKGWVMGYGLAGVQVGVPLAMAWYWLPTDKERKYGSLGEGHLLINPKILEQTDPRIIPGEGCLSIPHKSFSTKRYNYIKFLNDDRVCTAEGLEAQIVQHEVDHMNGILVVDREYKKDDLGRNDPCKCGSGKKYKKCCLVE